MFSIFKLHIYEIAWWHYFRNLKKSNWTQIKWLEDWLRITEVSKNGNSLYYKILLTIFILMLTCLLMLFRLFKALVRKKLLIYILFRTLESRKCQQLDTCYPFESTNITSKCKCTVCFQKCNCFPNTCLKMLISNSFQTNNENEKTMAVTTLLTFFPDVSENKLIRPKCSS